MIPAMMSYSPLLLLHYPQDEDQVSYKLKQATLCRVQLLSSHCTCSMMTPGLEITMETFHNPPHLVWLSLPLLRQSWRILTFLSWWTGKVWVYSWESKTMISKRLNWTTNNMMTVREKCSVPGFVHPLPPIILTSSKLWKLLERKEQFSSCKIRNLLPEHMHIVIML